MLPEADKVLPRHWGVAESKTVAERLCFVLRTAFGLKSLFNCVLKADIKEAAVRLLEQYEVILYS